MAAQQTIVLDGKSYVLLPREEYEKLLTLAKAADLPPFPAADADGNYPAVEYARASLARKNIRDRVAAGLSQRQLAKQAGMSFEHLCRIESGRHTPTVPTIDKIDRAAGGTGGWSTSARRAGGWCAVFLAIRVVRRRGTGGRATSATLPSCSRPAGSFPHRTSYDGTIA